MGRSNSRFIRCTARRSTEGMEKRGKEGIKAATRDTMGDRHNLLLWEEGTLEMRRCLADGSFAQWPKKQKDKEAAQNSNERRHTGTDIQRRHWSDWIREIKKFLLRVNCPKRACYTTYQDTHGSWASISCTGQSQRPCREYGNNSNVRFSERMDATQKYGGAGSPGAGMPC